MRADHMSARELAPDAVARLGEDTQSAISP